MNFKSFFYIMLFVTISCKKETLQKTWEVVLSSDKSLPIERHEAAFVKVEDKFYLLGGRKIKSVSIFDTKTKNWKLGKQPPLEMHHFQPIVYKSEIYIIGALTGKYPLEIPLNDIYIYNTVNDTWRKGGKIPENRLRGSTGNVLYKNKVYVSCGIKNGHTSGHKNWLDVYNLKTQKWEVLPDAPRARDHFQSVNVKDKIYLLGGRLSKAPKNTFSETIAAIDVYDIKNKKWSTLKHNIPTPRAGTMSVLYNDYIMVLGGESMQQKTAHKNVEGLHIKTLEWKQFSDLKQGRHGSGAINFNNSIYIASGSGNRGGSPELTTMEKFN